MGGVSAFFFLFSIGAWFMVPGAWVGGESLLKRCCCCELLTFPSSLALLTTLTSEGCMSEEEREVDECPLLERPFLTAIFFVRLFFVLFFLSIFSLFAFILLIFHPMVKEQKGV